MLIDGPIGNALRPRRLQHAQHRRPVGRRRWPDTDAAVCLAEAFPRGWQLIATADAEPSSDSCNPDIGGSSRFGACQSGGYRPRVRTSGTRVTLSSRVDATYSVELVNGRLGDNQIPIAVLAR